MVRLSILEDNYVYNYFFLHSSATDMKKNTVVFHKNLQAPKSPPIEVIQSIKHPKASKRPTSFSNNKNQSVKPKMKSQSKNKNLRGSQSPSEKVAK